MVGAWVSVMGVVGVTLIEGVGVTRDKVLGKLMIDL